MKVRTLFPLLLLLTLNAFSQKDLSAWVTDFEINGVKMKVLRMTKDELLANFKAVVAYDAHSYQNLLDTARNRYLAGRVMRNEGQSIPSYTQFIQVQAPDFPLNYYEDEMKAYHAWSKELEKKQKERWEDSLHTLELQKGYLWISAPFSMVKSKPDAKSMSIGKISRLSYVHAYEVDGVWAELEFGNYKGYILKSDLSDDWDNMELTDDELTELKKGHYYDFEETPAYTAQLKKQAAVEERSYQAANRVPARKYIRGPKGGCYFINSNGDKQYVDKGLCN